MACLLAWPAGADEFDSTIGVPAGFAAVRWRPSPISDGGKEAPLLLGARFRSADGKGELAVAVLCPQYFLRTRRASHPVTLARGEKVIDRNINRKKIADENRDYWHHDEETTVSGDGYTRYLLNCFSINSLPGACSILLEFRAADESSRKRYAAAY